MQIVSVFVLACLVAVASAQCAIYNNDCESCVQMAGCGYCVSADTCQAGTANGPTAANCTLDNWEFNTCPQLTCNQWTSCTGCLTTNDCVYCSDGTGECQDATAVSTDCSDGSAHYSDCAAGGDACNEGWVSDQYTTCTECVPHGYPSETCNLNGRCEIFGSSARCDCDLDTVESGMVVSYSGAECDCYTGQNGCSQTDCAADATCNFNADAPARRQVRALENGDLVFTFPAGVIPASAGTTTVQNTFLSFASDGTPQQTASVNIRTTQPGSTDFNGAVEALAFRLTVADASNVEVDLTGTGSVQFNFITYSNDNDPDRILLYFWDIPSGQTAGNGQWRNTEGFCGSSRVVAGGDTIRMPFCVANVQYQGYLRQEAPSPPSPPSPPDFSTFSAAAALQPAIATLVVAVAGVLALVF